MLKGRNVDDHAVAKFLFDRGCLRYSNLEIASKMGLARSNYCSYAKGKLPITIKFLKRFYDAFGNELKESKAPDNGEGDLNDRIQEISLAFRELLGLIHRFKYDFDRLYQRPGSDSEKQESNLTEPVSKEVI